MCRSTDRLPQHDWDGSISKGTNLGTTIRCAVAFGAHRLFLVGGGRGGRVRVGTHGAFGANHFLPQRTFLSWEELRAAAHGEGWAVVGVIPEGDEEAGSVSVAVDSRPFDRPTVFCTALKGKRLTPPQRAACDSFVHVRFPHASPCRPAFLARTAVLDTDILLSIALHHFQSWAQCQANSVKGQKYVLGARTLTGAVDEEERRRLQEERARYKARADILGEGREQSEGQEEDGAGEGDDGGGRAGWSSLWGEEEEEEENDGEEA
jgi:hypothetical protein